MSNKVTIIKPERNYGALTEASKSLNRALGDRTGRTVSIRTAHGFKRAFNLSDYDMDDNTAEDIVHGGMTVATALISSKSDGAKVGGILLLLGLFVCYQSGKE
ncbi:MAG TPA: hypothetical protein VK783_00885 [Bacteroidia bacterium]|jgi:hypothetical protein|nr:hypothetical protein [Bacteroidia bacterium]